MSQELNIIEKEPGFYNPYSRRRGNTAEVVYFKQKKMIIPEN